MENRREKFIRLAEKRTVKAMKAVRVLGKLANKNAYVWTEADVEKIVAALTREIEIFRDRMTTGKGNPPFFSLEEATDE